MVEGKRDRKEGNRRNIILPIKIAIGGYAISLGVELSFVLFNDAWSQKDIRHHNYMKLASSSLLGPTSIVGLCVFRHLLQSLSIIAGVRGPPF